MTRAVVCALILLGLGCGEERSGKEPRDAPDASRSLAPPGAPNIDGIVRYITDAQSLALCEWRVAHDGGAGAMVQCQQGALVSFTVPTVDECVAEVAALRDSGCNLVVYSVQDCWNLGPCAYADHVVCRSFRMGCLGAPR